MNKKELPINDRILMKIQTLLKEKKITFADFAKSVDYTHAGLMRAFDKDNLTLKTLEQICSVLEVDFSYFFETEKVVVKRIKQELKRHQKNPPVRPFFDDVCDEVLEGLKLEDAIRFVLDEDFLKKQSR
jgi:transcriptional regulator with XRE-family HTH domain